jgi:hypothetical protein
VKDIFISFLLKHFACTIVIVVINFADARFAHTHFPSLLLQVMFYFGELLFFRYLKYLLFLVVLIWFTDCQWDPDHSNPFDPDNPNYEEIGSLRLKIYPLNWNDDPIQGATVLIDQLSRFGVTDSTGEVYFDNVPADTITITAYRDSDDEIIYARNSKKVVIEPSKTTFDSLQLDALPIFDSTKVNSITIVVDDQTKVTAKLKAWVHDPDGNRDLKRVEFDSFDISAELHYNPDSLYYQLDVPSEDFPGGDLRNTLLQPFTFRAFDQAGNSSETTSLLARVINGYPEYLVYTFYPAPLVWNYALYAQLPDTSRFNYLVRIYTADIDRAIVYEKMVVPSISARNEHRIEKVLNFGDYYYQVWVIDLFGNMARSELGTLIVQVPYVKNSSKE